MGVGYRAQHPPGRVEQAQLQSGLAWNINPDPRILEHRRDSYREHRRSTSIVALSAPWGLVLLDRNADLAGTIQALAGGSQNSACCLRTQVCPSMPIDVCLNCLQYLRFAFLIESNRDARDQRPVRSPDPNIRFSSGIIYPKDSRFLKDEPDTLGLGKAGYQGHSCVLPNERRIADGSRSTRRSLHDGR